MSTFVSLGKRGPVTGQPDQTGFNPGNWTVVFGPDDINCNMPYFEICHMVVNGAAGATFDVYVDLAQWDTNQNGFKNSWDPAVPLPMRPGQYLYFYYSDNTSDGTPPVISIWLRYDQDIFANQQSQLGLSGSN